MSPDAWDRATPEAQAAAMEEARETLRMSGVTFSFNGRIIAEEAVARELLAAEERGREAGREARAQGGDLEPHLRTDEEKRLLVARFEVLSDRLCQTQGMILSALKAAGLTVVPLDPRAREIDPAAAAAIRQRAQQPPQPAPKSRENYCKCEGGRIVYDHCPSCHGRGPSDLLQTDMPVNGESYPEWAARRAKEAAQPAPGGAASEDAWDRSPRLPALQPAPEGSRPAEPRSNKKCCICCRQDVVGTPKMVPGPNGQYLCWECAK